MENIVEQAAGRFGLTSAESRRLMGAILAEVRAHAEPVAFEALCAHCPHLAQCLAAVEMPAPAAVRGLLGDRDGAPALMDHFWDAGMDRRRGCEFTQLVIETWGECLPEPHNAELVGGLPSSVTTLLG